MNFNFPGILVLAITMVYSMTKFDEIDAYEKFNYDRQRILRGDTLNPKLDSLKWTFYAMNYDKKARHYKEDDKLTYDVLECDVALWRQETNIQDTLINYFSFFRDNDKELYTPQSIYYIGIGYSYIAKNYFPVLSVGSLISVSSVDSSRIFFEKKEKAFLEYIKKYKKEMAPWLKQEAIRRGAVDN